MAMSVKNPEGNGGDAKDVMVMEGGNEDGDDETWRKQR